MKIVKRTKEVTSTAREVAIVGLMVALIEVFKVVMILPNIEVTSFLIIMFTLFYGKRIRFVIPAFILIEGLMFPVGLWWVMYLYAWPLLALITWLLRKQMSVWVWSVVSGIFGLSFGFLCSFPYFFIGAVEGGVTAGIANMFAWWIAGIPFDIPHGIGNFVIMLVLYHPVKIILQMTKKFLLEE